MKERNKKSYWIRRRPAKGLCVTLDTQGMREMPIQRNKCATGSVESRKLRIGTVNVGTMVGRSEEIADMAGRRNLDVCCLQETRWKGGSARGMGKEGVRFKFF